MRKPNTLLIFGKPTDYLNEISAPYVKFHYSWLDVAFERPNQLVSVFVGVMAATAWIIVFLVVVNCLVLGEKKREYKLGLLIPYRKVTPYFQNDYNKGESFAAAMTIAVERINANPTLLADYNLTFVWKDTECNELIAVREQLNQINSGVQAFIGPGCYCQTAAKNAAAFNMTMISFVSMQSFMLCSLISAFLR